MNREKIIVIDFGGQYNQLVARRVRECNVYCEIYSYKTDIAAIREMNPKGIILTGIFSVPNAVGVFCPAILFTCFFEGAKVLKIRQVTLIIAMLLHTICNLFFILSPCFLFQYQLCQQMQSK